MTTVDLPRGYYIRDFKLPVEPCFRCMNGPAAENVRCLVASPRATAKPSRIRTQDVRFSGVPTRTRARAYLRGSFYTRLFPTSSSTHGKTEHLLCGQRIGDKIGYGDLALIEAEESTLVMRSQPTQDFLERLSHGTGLLRS